MAAHESMHACYKENNKKKFSFGIGCWIRWARYSTDKIISTYTKSIHIYFSYTIIHLPMHIQILLTMFSLPMPMTNITTNIFMKMDNTAIRFLDVVYFLGMAVNKIVMIICTVELYPHRLYRIQQRISISYIHFDWTNYLLYLFRYLSIFIYSIHLFIYLFILFIRCLLSQPPRS